MQLAQGGAAVVAGEPFGEIESVKATAELMIGVSGQVVAVNGALQNNPGVINQDPFASGWMIKVKVADIGQVEDAAVARGVREEERTLAATRAAAYVENAWITPRSHRQQREAMLKAVGAAGMEDLLKQFPEQLRLKRPLDLPAAMDELTLQQHLSELAAQEHAGRREGLFSGGGGVRPFHPRRWWMPWRAKASS